MTKENRADVSCIPARSISERVWRNMAVFVFPSLRWVTFQFLKRGLEFLNGGLFTSVAFATRDSDS